MALALWIIALCLLVQTGLIQYVVYIGILIVAFSLLFAILGGIVLFGCYVYNQAGLFGLCVYGVICYWLVTKYEKLENN